MPTKHITPEEFDNHDCKQSAESGCNICNLWAVQKGFERKAVKEAEEKLFGKQN